MTASTDGGTTWNAGSIPTSVTEVTGVSCAAPYVCSAVGTTSAGSVMLGSLLEVKDTTLPGATSGSAYTFQLKATGGRPPYSWAIVSGHLPSGLTLSDAGLISGSPSSGDAPGAYKFKVQLTDSTPGTPQQTQQSLTLDLS
jgi:large repetitive protein